MIKQAIRFALGCIIGFGIVVGCGAAPEDTGDDASGLNGALFVDPLAAEIGTDSEAITSAFANGGRIIGYQVNTSPADSMCVFNPPSVAECHMPARKTWTVCVNGVNAHGAAAFAAAASALSSGTGFSVGTASCSGSSAGQIVTGVINRHLTLNSDEANYFVSGFSDTTVALSESLPGTYYSHNKGEIFVDETMLAALGGTVQVQQNRYNQVAGVALAKIVGLGYTGCGSASPHPITCTGFADGENSRPVLSTQKCMMTNYNVSSPTTFAKGATNCGTWPSGV